MKKRDLRKGGLSLSNHRGLNRVVVWCWPCGDAVFFSVISVWCILVRLPTHLRLGSSSPVQQLYCLRVSTYGPLDRSRQGALTDVARDRDSEAPEAKATQEDD